MRRYSIPERHRKPCAVHQQGVVGYILRALAEVSSIQVPGALQLEFFIFATEQWLVLSVFLLLVYAFIRRESSKGGTSISHHELTKLINADEAVVLDIRDTKEYASGHIAGASNIPFAKLQNRMSELERHRSKYIVLVDKFGQQTGSAGRMLGRNGYNVKRLRGGITDWVSEKLPTVQA